jgi:hypothetical protein
MPQSAPQILATAPEFVWELALGIYLVVKGFRRSRVTSREVTPVAPVAVPDLV